MAKIAILGFGTVGSGVYEVLQTNQQAVQKRAGEPVEVKYISVSYTHLDVYKRQAGRSHGDFLYGNKPPDRRCGVLSGAKKFGAGGYGGQFGQPANRTGPE